MDGQQYGDWESKIPPTDREDQVHDHLRTLNVQKSMGSEEKHPRVLRELADVFAKSLAMIFEKWHLDEVPGDWKRRNIVHIIKKRRNEDFVNDPPVSLTSLFQPRSLYDSTLIIMRRALLLFHVFFMLCPLCCQKFWNKTSTKMLLIFVSNYSFHGGIQFPW